MSKKVMAQGTFDILHPGHLHYLSKSAGHGDKLVVVVARDSNVDPDKDTFFDEGERVKMVDALEVVDRAILGSQEDPYSTVEKVEPDVITLGYDQDHSEQEVKTMAEETVGDNVQVKRIEALSDYSSRDIRRHIRKTD